MKNYYVFVLFLISPFFAFSQNCLEAFDSYEEAVRRYDAGRLYEVTHLLLPYTESTCFNNTQKANLHRLLALVYSEIEKRDSMVIHAEKMLINDPFYQMRKVDSKNFIDLLSDFIVMPKLSFSLAPFMGVSGSKTYINSLIFQGDQYKETVGNSFAYGFALGTEYAFNSRFSLGSGIRYNRYGYEMSYELVLNSLSNTVTYDYEQNQTIGYLELPIQLNFYHTFNEDEQIDHKYSLKSYRAYAGIGLFVGTLLHSARNAKLNILESISDYNNKPETASQIFTDELYKWYNYGLQTNIGIGKQSRNLETAIELYANYGLNNILDTSGKYQNNPSLFVDLQNEQKKLFYQFGISLKFKYQYSYGFKLTKSRVYWFFAQKVKLGRRNNVNLAFFVADSWKNVQKLRKISKN